MKIISSYQIIVLVVLLNKTRFIPCSLQTEQMLTAHLTHYLKKDSRIKAQNVAKEYFSCQVMFTSPSWERDVAPW